MRRFLRAPSASCLRLPTQLTGADAAVLVAHWRLPPSDRLEFVAFARPDLPSGASVRVIGVPPSAPSSRPGYGAAYPGGLGIGFPVTGLHAREALVGAMRPTSPK